MNRRPCILSLAAAGLFATMPATAWAQAWPSRPITLVVPAAAGGLADLVARQTAFHLEKALRQSVVVANRAGASGAIGTAFAAKAPADGYTLLFSLTSHVILPESDRLLGRAPAYELAQFQPVARVTLEPVVLMGQASAPEDTVRKVIEAARARPSTWSYASTGYYANGHVSMEAFAHAAQVKMLHAPYQGGALALAAVAGNQVNLTTAGPASASTFVKGGRLRALAIMGDRRLPGLPDVPTLKELGLDASYHVWTGLFAPAATPQPVLEALRTAMRTVMQDAAFIAAAQKMEATLDYQDAPEFQTFVQSESRRLGEVTRRIGKIPEAQ